MGSDPLISRTQIVIPSTPLAVRSALGALFDGLVGGPFNEPTRDAAQIVLAEALNNIVEHAYAQTQGEIEVLLEYVGNGLICRIEDRGLPMPEDRLPTGTLGPVAHGSDLPEGGFGWHLIRALSKDLHYCREGGRNRLSFRIDGKQFSQ